MASGSPPFSFWSCASLSAADIPAGPPPTIRHIDFEGLAFGHYLFSSAIIAGTTSNRSPTMP